MNSKEAQELRVLVTEVLAALRDGQDAVVPLTHIAMYIDSHDKDNPVTQDWVSKLPLLAQSALLSALRGPDSPYVPLVKKVTRWIRGLVLIPGDPANVVEFMNSELPDRMFEHTEVHKQMESVAQHFSVHLMLALEVVGYYHPDGIVKGHAYSLYTDMRHMFMATPEGERAFFSRMEDRKWPEDKHPQTAEEAFYLIKKHSAFSEHDRRLLGSCSRCGGINTNGDMQTCQHCGALWH